MLEQRLGTLDRRQVAIWRTMSPARRLGIAFQAYQFALSRPLDGEAAASGSAARGTGLARHATHAGESLLGEIEVIRRRARACDVLETLEELLQDILRQIGE